LIHGQHCMDQWRVIQVTITNEKLQVKIFFCLHYYFNQV
jgi:hypothetical protein